jgi:hypothetical protein
VISAAPHQRAKLVSLLSTGKKTSGGLLQCERAGFFQRRVPGLGSFRTRGPERSQLGTGKSPRPKQTPGTDCCPGAVREFQFPESTDLPWRVKRYRYHSLKIIMPVGAVEAAGVEAARLEIFVRSRRGTDRCDRASRPAQHRRARSAGRASPGFQPACRGLLRRTWASRSAIMFLTHTGINSRTNRVPRSLVVRLTGCVRVQRTGIAR